MSALRDGLTAWLQARWYGPRAPRYLLPLAALFRVVSTLRSGLYARGLLRSVRLPARVVVIGNIAVGGSGKTPLVAWLAGKLRDQGIAVGIVTRGYGGENRIPRLLDASAVDAGDEARWLAQETGVPVAVGRDRVAAARLLLDALSPSPLTGEGPSSSPSPLTGEGRGEGEKLTPQPIILADDGLQHYRLARDVEIVAVDGARGFGNGALLPVGPLREPRARLARAQAVVVKGEGSPVVPSGVKTFRMRYALGDAIPLAGGEAKSLTEFRGQTVAALAAIADPESFFLALEVQGLTIERHPLPDHVPVAEAVAALGAERPILMTDKDAIKLDVPPANAWRVPLALAFSPEDAADLLARVRGTEPAMEKT